MATLIYTDEMPLLPVGYEWRCTIGGKFGNDRNTNRVGTHHAVSDRRALCGLRAKTGWAYDLSYCERCLHNVERLKNETIQT